MTLAPLGLGLPSRAHAWYAEGAVVIVVGTPVVGGVTATGALGTASSTSGLYTHPVSVALTTWR